MTPAASVSFFRSEFDDFLYASIGVDRDEMTLMMNLGNDNAYTDERSAAELINAVITVGRRFFGHEDNGERTGDV